MNIVNDELISIIVPVYNVENYLNKCIDSILLQTYKHFELILIDDGSTDNSGIICDEYAIKDSRIRVYHQTNQGQSAARNYGIDISKGKWIHFVDSDDAIYPKMLEYLYMAVKENGCKMSACNRYDCDIIPPADICGLMYNCSIVDITEKSLAIFYEQYVFYWTPYASIIESSIIKNRKFTNGRILEDNAVCFKWLCDAGRIAVVELPMYFYRDNPNGTMNKPFSLKSLDYLWAMNEQVVYYDSIHYDKMLNLAFNDYFYAALTFSKRVREELKNVDVAKSIIKDINCNLHKYKTKLEKRDEYQRRLKKELHPFVFRIEKAIRNRLK